MSDQDDYRSSDDEDYNPEGAGEDGEDEVASSGDEVEEVTGKDGEIISGRRCRKDCGGKQSSSVVEPTVSANSEDVDAVFAAMLEEDAKNISQFQAQTGGGTEETPCQPSTSDDSSKSSKSEEVPKSTTTETKTITEVFDFAGEEIRVEKKVTAEEFDKREEQKKKAEEREVKRPTQKRVGLGDALTLLAKKPKMSILDKSNHDWKSFKQENDLNEELQTFNRGKNGYLNKVEFLTRADHREFENEKNMRNARRKPP